MSLKTSKLVFVLPEYDADTSTHFNYLVDLLEEAAEHIPVCLFIEKASSKPKITNIQECYVQKCQIKGLNLIERFFVFLWMRLRGYNRFYVHYSYMSAIISGIVTRLTGAKSFVWYCERKDLYKGGNLPFKLAIRCIHKVVTCTKLMAAYYHEFFKIPLNKLTVMNNWVDVSKIESIKSDHITDRKTVLFVHWLSKRKGTDYLPAIVEKTLAKFDCDFVIAGDGPEFEKLRESMSDSRVKMLGSVPNHEVISYYKSADVFIMPSREEEFGRVLIEAMASGTPIVAMDTLGTKAVLNNEQKNFVSAQGDTEFFSKKIVELLSDDSLREKLSKVGLERARNFDKKLSLEKFLEIIK